LLVILQKKTHQGNVPKLLYRPTATTYFSDTDVADSLFT
jgi:hypothetical protein